MTCIMRVAAVCLGTILLATACTAPGSVAQGDGTWIGGQPYDFNNPTNWKPAGVPTGTATIADFSAPAPFILFSTPVTTLAALRIEGDLSVTLEAGKSLTLTGQGLTICCSTKTQPYINGTLTGNVFIGDESGQTAYGLQGGGTINGNVVQYGSSISPGSRPTTSKLRVNGTYRLRPKGSLTIDVFADPVTPANSLDVAGRATLEGGALVIFVDDPSRTYPKFTVLSAEGGIQGAFGPVLVIPGAYKADVDYKTDPKKVQVTLTR